jgi:Transposase
MVNRSFSTSETNLRRAFSDLRGELHVHLEASELAPWVSAVITPLVHRVVCSHPAANAWIANDADKCDRIDAFKLAELLRLNRFKEVYYPQEKARREFKTLVQHYDELTAQQARLKTKLKARLRIPASDCSPVLVANQCWHRSARVMCAPQLPNSTQCWTRAWPRKGKRNC